ncbi:MAG: hypothetical protein ACTTHG_05460 [Treponemataceae bacterium]
MKTSDVICNSVDVSLKENSTRAIIAFIVSSIVFGAAYFAVFILISLFRGNQLLALPVLFFLFYVAVILLYGMAVLIYLLYSQKGGVLGHIFYFLRDLKRVFFMTLIFFVAFFILGIIAFIPYYLFANKILDKEIFSMAMNYDLQGMMSLDHGFSLEFNSSIGFWFLLMFFFLYSFAFVPNFLYDNPDKKLYQICKSNFDLLRKNYILLLWACIKASRLSFFVFILAYSIVLGSARFPFVRPVATVASLAYPVALVYCFIIFLFCFASLYDFSVNKNEEISDGFKIVEECSKECDIPSQNKILLIEDKSHREE